MYLFVTWLVIKVLYALANEISNIQLQDKR